jgi:hypothetical protein
LQLGLISIGVSPLPIDRAEEFAWIILVHEGAGSVIDRFSRNRHIVGIHDAVNETDEQPACNELCLSRSDKFKQREIWEVGSTGLRVMAGDDVIGEETKTVEIATGRKELKRSDANVAGDHSRENRPRKRCLACHRFS